MNFDDYIESWNMGNLANVQLCIIKYDRVLKIIAHQRLQSKFFHAPRIILSSFMRCTVYSVVKCRHAVRFCCGSLLTSQMVWKTVKSLRSTCLAAHWFGTSWDFICASSKNMIRRILLHWYPNDKIFYLVLGLSPTGLMNARFNSLTTQKRKLLNRIKD